MPSSSSHLFIANFTGSRWSWVRVDIATHKQQKKGASPVHSQLTSTGRDRGHTSPGADTRWNCDGEEIVTSRDVRDSFNQRLMVDCEDKTNDETQE